MGASVGQKKDWHQSLIPIIASVVFALAGFIAGDIRAQAANDTRWQELQPDIIKLRALPPADQVITKDQFQEVIRRLDEDVQQIRSDAKFLREREERRGR